MNPEKIQNQQENPQAVYKENFQTFAEVLMKEIPDNKYLKAAAQLFEMNSI